MRQDWIDKLEALQLKIEYIKQQALTDGIEQEQVLEVVDELIKVFIEEIKALFCMG